MLSKQNVLKVCSRTQRNLWLRQSGAEKSFTELTFKSNEDSGRRLKKQAATAKKKNFKLTQPVEQEPDETSGVDQKQDLVPRKESSKRSPFGCSLQRGSLLRGSEACFCFFPAPRPAACPRYPSQYTPSLSLPPRVPPSLPPSTLIVFPSDKDLITHREDLEPEPHSERKSEGQPIRNTSGKQLAHGAVKAPCVSL